MPASRAATSVATSLSRASSIRPIKKLPRAAAAPQRRALLLPPLCDTAAGQSSTMASLPRSMDSHASDGQRLVAAAAERNKDPILAVLTQYLTGAKGLLLEVASGTGQHTAHFAAALPMLKFQPTEYSIEDLNSIAAWGQGLPNVRPPMQLDASRPDSWGIQAGSCRAVYCANMCHISPWAATTGLVAGAGHVLQPGGELFIYGPFSIDGSPTTESNRAFDATLRQRNSEWGYRDVADVADKALEAGMQLVERRDMPANNFMLVFRKGLDA